MKRIIFFVGLLLEFSRILGQNDATPEIGKPCPNFSLTDVHYLGRDKVTLSDFRGKWLILDFGASWCKACWESYSKINQLQKQFKDRIQFLIVLYDDANIRPAYEKFRKRLNLELAVAYDTVLSNQFVPNAVPHTVWVDDKGVVQAISHSMDLTEEKLTSFVNGKKFDFIDKSSKVVEKGRQNVTNNYTIFGDDDSSLLFSSKLVKGNEEVRQFIPESIDVALAKKGKLEALNVWMYNLYLLAFFDRSNIFFTEDSIYNNYYGRLVLETKDSSFFKTFDKKFYFCYSQIVPKSKRTSQYCMSIMQQDLERFFGYKTSVETRVMPVWKLTATDDARIRLKTKGGDAKVQGTWGGVSFKNVPLRRLMGTINASTQQIPVFDESGIVGNIDIELDAMVTDINDVRKALLKNGLNLVPGQKEMKVIVVRDPEN